MRIGYGWDSHEFKRGVALKLGGVEVAHHSGLRGHSDGDVLLHALTDALLGAVAAGDIGTYFPPSDPKWKGADSAIFVREAMSHVRRAGYKVANVDSTLILQEPKIVPHARRMQERIAELLGITPEDVGVKAKTPEGMGTEKAAIAHVTVLLVKGGAKRERLAQSAEAEDDVLVSVPPLEVVDEVVEKTLRSSEPMRRPRPARSRH